MRNCQMAHTWVVSSKRSAVLLPLLSRIAAFVVGSLADATGSCRYPVPPVLAPAPRDAIKFVPSLRILAEVGAVAEAAGRVRLLVLPLIFWPLRAIVTTP